MTSTKEQKSQTEKDRIVDQYRRSFAGQAWHGPSVMSLLEGVTAAQASAHPIPGAHSIWELVLHIAAWESACTRRINGDRAQLTDEEDWTPVIDTSDPAWDQAKQHLVATHDALLVAVAGIDESKLDVPIVDDPEIPFSTLYVTLHGGVQHNLYHAGQIAILKRAIEGVAA
jgi:uncharacterized damage-inducible protein DinB